MSNTGWRHLIFLEVNRNPFLDPQVLKVVNNMLMSLVLVEFPSLGIKVASLRPIFFEEAVHNLLGDFKVLPIWLCKLLQKFLGKSGVSVLELGIYLEIALEESVIALLQILGQGISQGLQFYSVLLWLLGWGH